MDAYSTGSWTAAFAAIAGSAAALTGLLFVALSINLDRVIKGEGLVGRAIEVLVLLTAALLVSTLLLMPAQPTQAAASEVLSIAFTAEVFLTYIQVRAALRKLRVTRTNFAMRVLGGQVGLVLLLAGGVSLLAQSGGGLYWILPGLLAAMVAGIVGAWVMLVEIVR